MWSASLGDSNKQLVLADVRPIGGISGSGPLLKWREQVLELAIGMSRKVVLWWRDKGKHADTLGNAKIKLSSRPPGSTDNPKII